jgi:hypothetical protein
MPSSSENFSKYPNKVFIETGSYVGDGIKQALNAGFMKVFSIELSGEYYRRCKKRFKIDPRVSIIHGDSYKVLPDLLKKINTRITFWLDGHYSCGNTALGDYYAPLMQELQSIKDHHIKEHTILIDDMRCWKELNHVHGFCTDDIISKLLEINPNYKLEYLDGAIEKDILVASI